MAPMAKKPKDTMPRLLSGPRSYCSAAESHWSPRPAKGEKQGVSSTRERECGSPPRRRRRRPLVPTLPVHDCQSCHVMLAVHRCASWAASCNPRTCRLGGVLPFDNDWSELQYSDRFPPSGVSRTPMMRKHQRCFEAPGKFRPLAFLFARTSDRQQDFCCGVRCVEEWPWSN